MQIRYKIAFFKYDLKSGLIIIRSSFKLFLSEIWGNFTNSIIPIVITNLIGNFELGIFNIADRIKSIAVQIMHPITYTLFPRMSKKYALEKQSANKSFLKIIFFSSLIVIGIYFITNLYINQIVNFFSKEYANQITALLRILLFSFILNVFSDQFITYYFIPNNMYNFINNNKVIKFVICISLIFPLLLNYGIIGAAYAYIISEFISLCIIIRKYYNTKL